MVRCHPRRPPSGSGARQRRHPCWIALTSSERCIREPRPPNAYWVARETERLRATQPIATTNRHKSDRKSRRSCDLPTKPAQPPSAKGCKDSCITFLRCFYSKLPHALEELRPQPHRIHLTRRDIDLHRVGAMRKGAHEQPILSRRQRTEHEPADTVGNHGCVWRGRPVARR